MTSTRIIRLTCDRCGADETHDDADGHRPATWQRIAFGLLTGDLCPDCTAHIALAMRAPDAPPPPPPAPRQLCLTIEDRRVAIDDAEVTICNAISEAVAEFRQTPTRLLDPDAFADVLNDKRPLAEALVDRIHAKVKERVA